MAKNHGQKKAEAVVEPTPAPAPSLKDLLDAAKAAQEAFQTMQAEAQAAVETAATPYKERMMTTVIAPRIKEQERHKAAMAEFSTLESAIAAEAAEAGIDRVFLGPVAVAQSQRKASTGGSGKNVKLEDLASLTETIIVTAPQRTGKHEPIEVAYTIIKVDGTDDKGNAVVTFAARGQKVGSDTVREGNLTEAASLAGWHQTRDVAFALAVKAGVLGKYEGLEPHSPKESILVDGEHIS